MDLKKAADVKDAILATVSHPKFKRLPIKPEIREDVKKLLIKEATRLRGSEVSPNTEKKKQSNDTDFFHYSDDEESSANTITSDEVSVQVTQYLLDKDTSMEMLHKYPLVKTVFLCYNTTLPSSAPVERLFSWAAIILWAKRGLLSDEVFEKILILKACDAMRS